MRDRKQSSSAIRRVSSASIGRGSSTSSEQNNNGASPAASADSSASNANGDNGKARRTNTFRLAKPTLMPPLEVTISKVATARGRYTQNNNNNNNSSSNTTNINAGILPAVMIPPLKPATSATSSPALIITSSSPAATARHQSCSSSSSASSAGSSPSSVTTVTTIESHSSSTGQVPSRDLIGEYLAAESRHSQQTAAPPPIFNPKLIQTRDDAEQLALAYKHPILLMDEEEHVYCSVISSVGNERNREVEIKYIDDNSIELLDAKEELNEGETESLIVPRPKMIAFHSLKGSPTLGEEGEEKCRLVGKVNPNILKTWEQLSGGCPEKNFCEHKRKNSRNSLITVTSSENSGDKQSCLIFYRNQYNMNEEASDFTVTRIRHSSISTSSTTVADESAERTGAMTATISMVTSTTTTETSSEGGCYDFYDSIDDSSNRVVELGDDEDEYALAAGEGLADFTSLDRKRLMWSIDVE